MDAQRGATHDGTDRARVAAAYRATAGMRPQAPLPGSKAVCQEAVGLVEDLVEDALEELLGEQAVRQVLGNAVGAHDLVGDDDRVVNLGGGDGILGERLRGAQECRRLERDRADRERAPESIEIRLFLDAELLPRLAADLVQALVDALVPDVVGEQVRPGAERQIENGAAMRDLGRWSG